MVHLRKAVVIIIISGSIALFGQTNLITTNPSFENWTSGKPDGWAYGGISYIDQEATIIHGGSGSARYEVPATSTTAELTQDILVTPGDYYTFSCWVYDGTLEGEMGLLINWRDASDAHISTVTSSNSGDGGWQSLKIENRQAPVNANVARIKIRAYKQSDASGGFVYADDALFYNDESLPVMMNGFHIQRTDEGHLIEWSTASEVDIFGYHIFRSDNREGPYQQITNTLIVGQGNQSLGSSYQFIDYNADPSQNYWYKLDELTLTNDLQMLDMIYISGADNKTMPVSAQLNQIFPNPFNPMTTIHFSIADLDAGIITIDIVNVLGQKIHQLAQRRYDAGLYSIQWNGEDNFGAQAPSGVYFAQLLSNGNILDARKMVKTE